MPIELRNLSIKTTPREHVFNVPQGLVGYSRIVNQERMLDGDPTTFGAIEFFFPNQYWYGSFYAIAPFAIEIPIWEYKLWFYEVNIKIGRILTQTVTSPPSLSYNLDLVRWEVFFIGTSRIRYPTYYGEEARIQKEDLLFTTVVLRDYELNNYLPLFEVMPTILAPYPPVTTFSSPQNTTIQLTMNTQVIDKSIVDTSTYSVPTHSLGSESAFGMLFPDPITLNAIPALKIVICFVFFCFPMDPNSIVIPIFSVEIYDIHLKVPSPSGDIYIWNENTGLSFVGSGINTPIYDGNLSTYMQTSSSSPKSGILAVFPKKVYAPGTPLKVYAKSSTEMPQTISYYTGIGTVPPSGSPTTQVTVNSPGWYTLLTDSYVNWSYFII